MGRNRSGKQRPNVHFAATVGADGGQNGAALCGPQFSTNSFRASWDSCSFKMPESCELDEHGGPCLPNTRHQGYYSPFCFVVIPTTNLMEYILPLPYPLDRTKERQLSLGKTAKQLGSQLVTNEGHRLRVVTGGHNMN